jgi:hypothetical protein
MSVSLSLISFVAENPHLGHVKIFSSIFDFIRVSHLGQNFIKTHHLIFLVLALGGWIFP